MLRPTTPLAVSLDRPPKEKKSSVLHTNKISTRYIASFRPFCDIQSRVLPFVSPFAGKGLLYAEFIPALGEAVLNGYQELFRRGQIGQGVKLTTYRLRPWLGMSGAIHPVPHTPPRHAQG